MAKGDFGFNGTFSTTNMGSRKVRVLTLDFGLNIVASSDNESRSRRAFYSKAATEDSFVVGVCFVSWAEREAFNRWMHRYMVGVSEGTVRNGYMTVRCPTRNFTRVAVPKGPLEYGEGVGDMAYRVQVNFVGAHDPVDLDLTSKMAGVSYFKGPRRNSVASHFYPRGNQASGAESLDGTLFDDDGGAVTPIGPSAGTNLNNHLVNDPGV